MHWFWPKSYTDLHRLWYLNQYHKLKLGHDTSTKSSYIDTVHYTQGSLSKHTRVSLDTRTYVYNNVYNTYMVADIILEKRFGFPSGTTYLLSLTPEFFFYSLYFVRRVHFTDEWVQTIFCGPNFPIFDSH